jgi:hypothetical protein
VEERADDEVAMSPYARVCLTSNNWNAILCRTIVAGLGR